MQTFSNNVNVNETRNICICGAGAVGSFLAFVFSRVCNNIVIVDPDTFEPHNVATHFVSVHSLQFGSGISKVEAVKKTIDSFMPSAIIHCYQQPAESLQHDATIDSVDVFIIATDSVASRIAILQHLQQFARPVIDVGISHDGYNITVLQTPDDIPKYIELLQQLSERQEDEQRACEQARNLPVIVSLAAELMRVLSAGDSNV